MEEEIEMTRAKEKRLPLFLRQTGRHKEFFLFSGTSNSKTTGFKDLESEDRISNLAKSTQYWACLTGTMGASGTFLLSSDSSEILLQEGIRI